MFWCFLEKVFWNKRRKRGNNSIRVPDLHRTFSENEHCRLMSRLNCEGRLEEVGVPEAAPLYRSGTNLEPPEESKREKKEDIYQEGTRPEDRVRASEERKLERERLTSRCHWACWRVVVACSGVQPTAFTIWLTISCFRNISEFTSPAAIFSCVVKHSGKFPRGLLRARKKDDRRR